MELSDLDEDTVAMKLLKEKIDLHIVVMTADEKIISCVNKTISICVSAFFQKPFTFDKVKKAIDVTESEYSLL
jgi:AmiR/NasT family two-component response regulator